MVSAQLLIAQQAADDTGQTIRLIIFALLAVALLLALLTAWYWRHTDPRRSVGAEYVEPARPAAASQPFPTAAVASAQALSPTGPGHQPEVDDGADEWLRLTGPQSLRRGP